MLFTANDPVSIYLLVDGRIIYFEFITLIIKCFQSNYHFPLQYFIYIAITSVIRLIVVEHKNPQLLIVYSGTILILVIILYIANAERLKPEIALETVMCIQTLWIYLFVRMCEFYL